ncbi:MAG: hypothetical protein ABIZ91_01460 [Gemmatimonadaceae bacterium]
MSVRLVGVRRGVARLTMVTLSGGLLVVGCRSRPTPGPSRSAPPVAIATPPPLSPWPGTLAAALRAAENGRFGDVEQMLVEFSVQHAGTPEGAESDFWRALLKLDPNNRGVSPREQTSMLDAYLSGGSTQPRYAEALILRRVAEAMDSTRALLATVRASAEARDKGRDDEIRRLNDLVDRTSAELERIKRRLAPKVP